jgi:hypothetical protein
LIGKLEPVDSIFDEENGDIVDPLINEKQGCANMNAVVGWQGGVVIN